MAAVCRRVWGVTLLVDNEGQVNRVAAYIASSQI